MPPLVIWERIKRNIEEVTKWKILKSMYTMSIHVRMCVCERERRNQMNYDYEIKNSILFLSMSPIPRRMPGI